MSAIVDEFFGEPAQQALQRRSDYLWTLLKDDPRFCCHGRAIGLAEATEQNIGDQIALAKLQGAASVEGVPKACAKTRQEALASAGLKTDQFDVWYGDAGALSAAEELIRSTPLPSDLAVVSVDGDTACEDMAQLDALTQSCGVLLPMGAFMRGVPVCPGQRRTDRGVDIGGRAIPPRQSEGRPCLVGHAGDRQSPARAGNCLASGGSFDARHAGPVRLRALLYGHPRRQHAVQEALWQAWPDRVRHCRDDRNRAGAVRVRAGHEVIL